MKPENEIRGSQPGPELRAAEDGGMPKLTGYPIVFNSWTTIHSHAEGHFREMIASSATAKTLQEHKPKIIFNHGDSLIKEQPIAPSALIADERGVRYDEPELYGENEFIRSLVPPLRDGEFGSSFKFSVNKEKFDESPERSDDNPDGIPERTITELRLFEAGPVVWPAYADATAGVRSLTDHFRRYTLEEAEELFERWAQDPERLKRIADVLGTPIEAKATEDDAEVPSDEDGSPSDKHSPGAEQASHSKASRKKDQALYGVKAKQPAWRLPTEE